MPDLSRFDTNVFVNCPFDDEYQPLLRTLIFTVLSCGFTPVSALQERDAGAVRLDKIKRMISASRLGIHDISRTELDSENELPRFNMPFELGLELGARYWGSKLMKRKRIMILDTERYRFQKFLSDIAGQDISAHEGKPEVLVAKVRDWLNTHRKSDQAVLPSARHLIESYGRLR